MKEYLMRIIGAVLIYVFADMLLTEKWSKYIKIITGLIIISAISAPFEKPLNLNFKEYFNESKKLETNGIEYSVELVKKELEKSLANDINSRFIEEFNQDIEARVDVSLNEENKISGVEKINLIGEVNQKMVDRINEIYAPKEVLINGF